MIEKRHPATLPNPSGTPVGLQSWMSGSVKIWDKDRFNNDSIPGFLCQLGLAIPNLIMALLNHVNEDTFGAIEAVLQAERSAAAIAGCWKG